MQPASDAAWFVERAWSIAQGDGYVVEWRPTAYWPVGYPAFLAGIFALAGRSIPAAMIANALLAVGALYLAYRIARRLFDSEKIARITLALLAVHPNGIAYSSLLMSESLFLFLMMLGVALLLASERRLAWSLAAGVVFGAAILVKPQAMLVPVICWTVLSIAGHGLRGLRLRWKIPVITYAAALLVVFPWTLRNYAVFGEHGIISTNDGINLWIGNNPEGTGRYFIETRKRMSHMRRIVPAQEIDEDEHEENIRHRAMALAYIRTHPVEAIGRIPKKLWYLYRADTEGFSQNLRSLENPFIVDVKDGVVEKVIEAGGYSRESDQLYAGESVHTTFQVLKIVAEGWWIVVMALAGITLIRGLFIERASFFGSGRSLGFWIIGYFTIIPIVYFGDGRFHAPAIPWIAMYAAATLALASENAKFKMMNAKRERDHT